MTAKGENPAISKEGIRLGERIKRRREELAMTQDQLAKAVGVHVVNVSRWENGARGISGINLIRLARALDVTRSWLLEETDPTLAYGIPHGQPHGQVHSWPQNGEAPMPNLSLSKVGTDSILGVKRTPRPRHDVVGGNHASGDADEWVSLPSLEAAAGLSGMALPSQISYLQFKRSFLREFGNDAANMGTVFAVGDSMAPSISNGDMALVKIERDAWKRGGIMLVRLDDGLMLKRVQVTHDGVARLLSDNPLYPPVEVHTHGEDFAVIGRVVWTGRRM